MIRSKPEYYKIVEYYINSFDDSETGVTALHACFSSDAHKHLKLEPKLPLTTFINEHVRELNKNFQHLQDVSMKHQQDIVAQRTVNKNPTTSKEVNSCNYVVRIILEKVHNNKLNH